jgi:hypothetical protein
VINILIYAPREDYTHQPIGLSFVNEFFVTPKQKKSVSFTQENINDLRRTAVYLKNRYPGRLRFHWVNPWSLSGIWIAFRYRLKSFPTVLIDNQIKLTENNLKDLTRTVDELLSQPNE